MPTPEYCLFQVDWWPLCMTKSEWSGWVQAVGAVLAILAGAIAVWWQVRKSRLATLEFQRAEDIRILGLIAVANVGCLKALKLAKLQLEDVGTFVRTVDGFKAHCSALAGIPLLQIPDIWVAMIIGRAVQERERLATRLKDAFDADATVEAIDTSLREFLECERVVGAALAERKAYLPYGKTVIGGHTVLHCPPEKFDADG